MHKAKILLLLASAAMFFFVCIAVVRVRAQSPGASPGLFPEHRDIGTVLHAGSTDYDAAKDTYTLAGSGENMWFTADAFQFAWKKVSGDVTLTADISFLGTGGNPHRKAVLMIRQSLDADSPYADVALHGVGLTSLQFREEKGATTHEVQANISAPKRLRIEKRGDYFHMLLGDGEGTPLGGRIAANPVPGAILRGNRCLLPRQGCGGAGRILARRSGNFQRCRTESAGALQHSRGRADRLGRPAGHLRHAGTHRSAQLDARRQLADLQSRRAHRTTCPRPAASRKPSTPGLPRAATTITVSPRTELCWPSAIRRRETTSP